MKEKVDIKRKKEKGGANQIPQQNSRRKTLPKTPPYSYPNTAHFENSNLKIKGVKMQEQYSVIFYEFGARAELGRFTNLRQAIKVARKACRNASFGSDVVATIFKFNGTDWQPYIAYKGRAARKVWL